MLANIPIYFRHPHLLVNISPHMLQPWPRFQRRTSLKAALGTLNSWTNGPIKMVMSSSFYIYIIKYHISYSEGKQFLPIHSDIQEYSCLTPAPTCRAVAAHHLRDPGSRHTRLQTATEANASLCCTGGQKTGVLSTVHPHYVNLGGNGNLFSCEFHWTGSPRKLINSCTNPLLITGSFKYTTLPLSGTDSSLKGNTKRNETESGSLWSLRPSGLSGM